MWCISVGFLLAISFNSTPLVLQTVASWMESRVAEPVEQGDAVPTVGAGRRLLQTSWASGDAFHMGYGHVPVSLDGLQIGGVLVLALLAVPLGLGLLVYLGDLYGQRMRAHLPPADGLPLVELQAAPQAGTEQQQDCDAVWPPPAFCEGYVPPILASDSSVAAGESRT